MANWEIMHGDRLVARLGSNGRAKLFSRGFVPCGLNLKDP